MSTTIPKQAPSFSNLLLKFNNTFKHIINRSSISESSSDLDASFHFQINSDSIIFDYLSTIVYFDELNVPFHDYLKMNDYLQLDHEDIIALHTAIPKFNFEYVQRVYLDMNIKLVDGRLPTEVEYKRMLGFDVPNDFNLIDELPIDQLLHDDDKIILDDVPNMSTYSGDDISFEEINPSVSQEIVNYETTSSSSPNQLRRASDNIPNNYDDSCDVHLDGHGHEWFNNGSSSPPISHSSTSSSSGNGNPQRKQLNTFWKQKMRRSGPKQRGSQRCNSNSNITSKKKGRTYQQVKKLTDLRAQKREDKLKLGRDFKGTHKKGVNKDAKLVNEAYRYLKDCEYAAREGKLEAIKTELDFIQHPDIHSEHYDNAFKERQYMEDQVKRLSEEKKKKEYKDNEVRINKRLTEIISDFKHSDLTGVVRTSSLCDDLDKIEEFIQENVADNEAMSMIVNTVADEIVKQPTLLDKCSVFLKDLIMKIKPLAFGIDTVRDVKMGIDILKEDFNVTMGDSLSFPEICDDLNVIDPDMRTDHQRRGDLIHKDPLLRRFQLKRVLRDGILSEHVDYAGIFSTELLFQLLAPNICQMNLTPEQVTFKMIHEASNISTINLPKWALLVYGTDVVQDTLCVARALYLTRLKVSKALGFCQTPQ